VSVLKYSRPKKHRTMGFDRRTLAARLRSRVADILLAVGFAALCLGGSGGPVWRQARGYPPLPTAPRSRWDTPVWETEHDRRGELAHPLAWRDAGGHWVADRTCTPAQLSACLGPANGTVAPPPWCCVAMLDPASPAFDERVYSWELVLFYTAVVAAAVLADGHEAVPPRRCYVAGLAVATALAALSRPVKAAVGRPRPSFYAQQLWALRSRSAAAPAHLDDALKSFPSGHATWALCSGVFASGLALREAPTWRRAGVVVAFAWEALPSLLGTWIAVTRVEDYRHFPSDILAGALLGTLAALAGVLASSGPRGLPESA